MDVFSPAQIMGYVAFLLGAGGFLQKDDRRFKIFNIGQCLAYVVHFALLGNPTASASSIVSGTRSLLALKTRSPVVAVIMASICMILGGIFARDALAWLPVVGSTVATLAIFLLSGIPMRLALLFSTVLWLTNNILSGSIGGGMLEGTIAVANISTMIRLYRNGRIPAAQPETPSAGTSPKPCL